MYLIKVLFISAFSASAHCLTEFHCKPKSGCQISQCDPISYQFESDLSEYLETKEFPILCKTKEENAGDKQEKSGANDAEFKKYVFERLNKLENSVKDLTKYVTDLHQKYNIPVDNNAPTTISTLFPVIQNSDSDKTECKPPMVFNRCPRRCKPTCDNPKPLCSRGCANPGCVCPFGMVFEASNVDKCVTLNQCNPKCEPPMVFDKCPTICKPTCDNPKPLCFRGCAAPGCVCPQGMVYKAPNVNECLTPRQCKPECKPPMIFNICPRPCKPTCRNPNPECSRGCGTPGCVCPSGMVYSSSAVDECYTQTECVFARLII